MTNVSYSSNQMNIYPNLSLGVFLKSPALEVTPFWGSRFQGPGRLAAWSLLDGWMLRFVWPRLVSWPQDICKSSKERGTTARNHQNVLCGDVFPIPKLSSLMKGRFSSEASRLSPWVSAVPRRVLVQTNSLATLSPWGCDSMGGALRTSSLPLAISVASWRCHWYDHWWLMIIV
jgi:hypothetical protein